MGTLRLDKQRSCVPDAIAQYLHTLHKTGTATVQRTAMVAPEINVLVFFAYACVTQAPAYACVCNAGIGKEYQQIDVACEA
jgi:hypothetical protein